MKQSYCQLPEMNSFCLTAQLKCFILKLFISNLQLSCDFIHSPARLPLSYSVRYFGVCSFLLHSFLQGNRDESYEVDEVLAEQDAVSLFEVAPAFHHFYLTALFCLFVDFSRPNKLPVYRLGRYYYDHNIDIGISNIIKHFFCDLQVAHSEKYLLSQKQFSFFSVVNHFFSRIHTSYQCTIIEIA